MVTFRGQRQRLEQLYTELIAFAVSEFDRGEFESQGRALDVALDVRDAINALKE